MALRSTVFFMENGRSPSNVYDRKEFFGAAAGYIAAMMDGDVLASENESFHEQPKTLQLSTGRTMEFYTLGDGDTPCILIHGFLGSGNTYACIHALLAEHGITAIAPNLYGKKTDWRKRSSIMDAGRDIAALSSLVHGTGAIPTIMSCSAGIKDGIATCIACNERKDVPKAPLYLISGQVDMNRSDVFELLSSKDQFELDALLGRPKGARFRVFQPFRNMSARVKQRIAENRVKDVAHTPAAAAHILSKFSRSDREYLKKDPEFEAVLVENAVSYSSEEIIDSIERLFGWDMDLRKLAGSRVRIVHGTDDRLVHPGNARILEALLKKAGVNDVRIEMLPGGHLLLRERAAEFVPMMKE